jgi:hypothetical protein
MSLPTSDKAHAWNKVWSQLKIGNPVFFEAEGTGLECALAEIRRLQSAESTLNIVREVIGRSAGDIK